MKRGCLLNSIADFTQISYGFYSNLVYISLTNNQMHTKERRFTQAWEHYPTSEKAHSHKRSITPCAAAC